MVTFRRLETMEQLDYYPTPPWATRALFKYVIGNIWGGCTCLEPACGGGHMARVLSDYFKIVIASDIHDYGVPGTHQVDFLTAPITREYDWVITNPPFNLAEKFIWQALCTATVGVAIFARLQLLESVRRYKQIFEGHPPSIVAPFVERVHLAKNKIIRHCGSTCCYTWFVWNNENEENKQTELRWIPPCRKDLEQDEDYDEKLSKKHLCLSI